MTFKTMIYDVIVQFRNTLVGNVEYCERAVLDIAKEYEAEVAELKLSINQLGHIQDVMQNVFSDLNEKHQKNIVCSMVWEDLQKRGTDIE
jgi:replicative DNA helicase